MVRKRLDCPTGRENVTDSPLWAIELIGNYNTVLVAVFRVLRLLATCGASLSLLDLNLFVWPMLGTGNAGNL